MNRLPPPFSLLVAAALLSTFLCSCRSPTATGITNPIENESPIARYRLAADKSRPGLCPNPLNKRHANWSAIGQPGARAESLLDEYGTLQPFAGSCSLMPYVFAGGKLLSASDANLVTQSLDSGYLPLPSVMWDLTGLEFTVEALSCGSVQDAITYVRYALSNNTAVAQTGRMFLAIRPAQVTPLQAGELSDIASLEFVPGGEWPAAVKVNGAEQFLSLMPPDGFGTCAFDQGDVMRYLAQGELPPAQKLDNAGRLLSGALAFDFDLKPGDSKSVVIAAPLHGKKEGLSSFMKRGFTDSYAPDDAFRARRADNRNAWLDLIDRMKISLPDPEIVNALKSQVVYHLTHRGDAPIQPASQNKGTRILDMLVKERDGKLVLLEGVPEKWMREKNGVRIENLPTQYGALDMKARAADHTLTITLGGNANPPNGVEILWPLPEAPGRVAVDGYKWTEFDDQACHLPSMAHEIVAEWAKP